MALPFPLMSNTAKRQGYRVTGCTISEGVVSGVWSKEVSPDLAMKLIGHKTESIYRRNAIVSESDLAEGVARLAAPYESQTDGHGHNAVAHFPLRSVKAPSNQGQS